jgi:hypothetical protein
MKVIYLICAGLVLFVLRQITVPLIGGLADMVLLALPAYNWFWRGKTDTWWSLLLSTFLLDLIVVRGWPIYTVASMVSILLCDFLVLPYLSQATNFTKLITLIVWLALWRACYFACLALAWFLGGPAIDFVRIQNSLIGWLVMALIFVVGFIVISRQTKRLLTGQVR